MSAFTSGKYAKGQCDRCDWRYQLLELKLEWTGLLVCPICWDPKDPLEFPTNFPIDPESVQNPRPDTDVEAGQGTIKLPKGVGSSFSGISIVCEIGNVTVTVA